MSDLLKIANALVVPV